MKTRSWNLISLVLVASWVSPAKAQPAVTLEARRPNIIFVLTDDQGYGDLSCHGNPILKTPNLDRLHDEGVRFTDFHVSPTCSPTRSALMTGRHEFKNGVTHTILERERLTLKATTVAQVLKSAGYTTGIFGKWHLGDEPDHWPDKRGFDEMFIHGCGGIGQSYPGSCGDVPGNTYFDPTILHNGKFEKTKGYCTDVFFGQALRWIESVKGKKPFFCYLATNAPHAPLQVRPEDEKRYADKVKNPNVAKFFGMIANIDDNVGRLLDKLKEWGIERDTLVIFMNDNGGTAGVSVYQRRHARQQGHALAGRHAGVVVLALAGHAEARRRRPAGRPHRLLPHRGRDRRGEVDRRGEGAGRGPKPGAAVARPEGGVARPDPLHARRPLAERGEAGGPQVRPCAASAARAGTWSAIAQGRQEAVAVVRREGRPRREDRRGRQAS